MYVLVQLSKSKTGTLSLLLFKTILDAGQLTLFLKHSDVFPGHNVLFGRCIQIKLHQNSHLCQTYLVISYITSPP